MKQSKTYPRNPRVCQMEKEAREKRLLAYAEAIQKSTLEVSSQIIKELVEQREVRSLLFAEYH